MPEHVHVLIRVYMHVARAHAWMYVCTACIHTYIDSKYKKLLFVYAHMIAGGGVGGRFEEGGREEEKEEEEEEAVSSSSRHPGTYTRRLPTRIALARDRKKKNA